MSNIQKSQFNEQEQKYFDSQFSLNKKELENIAMRPPHWDNLINDVKFFLEKNKNINTIRDLGCGSGVMYKIINDEFEGGKYYGYDKSEYAIELARHNYSKDNFFVFDLNNINETFIENDNEILYMSALLDVLPNSNDILKMICSFQFKNIIIHRMNINMDGTQPSGYSEYMAYDVLPSYSFFHNKDDLISIISEGYNYEIYQNGINNGYNLRMVRR